MDLVFERLIRSFASMQQRDFRFLTFSTAALGFGQWFQQIGLGWLVLELTGSAAQIGAVTFIQGIMVLVVSVPAGVLADRYSRRDVLVWTTGVGVAQALALAVLVVSGQTQTWHLYAFAFIGGVATGFTQPVRQALVYDLTTPELLTNAMTVSSLAQNVARVTGPPMAGAILGLLGTSSAFFVLAGLKVLAMTSTMLIRSSAQPRVLLQKESPFTSLTDGLRYSFRSPGIRALLVATTVAPVLVYPYVQYLPVFAKDVLHGGAETYGILASGVGWGSLLGLGVLVYLGDVRRKGTVFLASHAMYIGMVIAFSRAESLPVSMAFLVLAGVCNSVSGVLNNILFQLVATNEMRGRVMALHSMSNGLQPMGSLPMGLAMERWGAPNTVSAFMAAALTVLLSVAVFFPELRRVGMSPASAEESQEEVSSGIAGPGSN